MLCFSVNKVYLKPLWICYVIYMQAKSSFCYICYTKCDHLSKNYPKLIVLSYSTLFSLSREWFSKISALGKSSVGITVLESKKNKEINLYSDYTKSKLQVLAFAVITYVLIAELWLTMFTMDFLINKGIVPFLYSFVLAKKAIPF